jgi:hypothetical protein
VAHLSATEASLGAGGDGCIVVKASRGEFVLSAVSAAYKVVAEGVTNYVRHPTCDRGIAHDRGKPRDLSLSYVARDRGNTRLSVNPSRHGTKSRPLSYLILSYLGASLYLIKAPAA